MVTLKPPAIALPGVIAPLPSTLTSGSIINFSGFEASRSIIVAQVSHGGMKIDVSGRLSLTN